MIASLFKKQHRFSLSRALGVTVALASLSTQGCIGDEEIGGGEPTVDESKDVQGYSFKGYLRGPNEEEFTLIKTPPMEAYALENAFDASRDTQGAERSLHDVGVEAAQKEQAAVYAVSHEQLAKTSWSPAFYAAQSCASELGVMVSPTSSPSFLPGAILLWAGVAQENPDYPTTCDAHVLLQQNMLCTAAKLAEMADAVHPITLRFDYSSAKSSNPQHTFVVPPQSNEERFILRDQAMVILDLLAKLANAFPTTKGPTGSGLTATMTQRCSQAYWAAYTTGTVGTSGPVRDQSTWANLGLGTLPSGTPAPEVVRAWVRPRAELQAHIARAATRLVRELVEESLAADLAGAEQARSLSTGDAWAMDPKKNLQGYNTYRHAVRVLLGSWEPFGGPFFGSDSDYLGPGVDPRCNGYANIRYTQFDSDLTDAIPGLDLEVALTAPQTSRQSLAWRMFRSTGLVVPDSAAKEASALRAALRKLLLSQAAAKAGVTTSPEFEAFSEGPIGTALARHIDDLGDADLRYGARRAVVIYSLLTSQEELATGPVATMPGSTPATPWGGTLAQDLTTLGAFVVAEGIPEHELNRSSITKFAPAAQDCSSGVRRIVERLQVPLRDLSTLEPLERLANEALSESSGMTKSSMPARFRALENSTFEGDPVWRALIYPQDSGVEGLIAAWDQLRFIQGTSMEVECAVGLRDSCSGVTAASIELPILESTPPSLPETILTNFGAFLLGKLEDNEEPVWAVIPRRGNEPGMILGRALAEPDAHPVWFSDWELGLLDTIKSGRTITAPDCTPVYDAANTSHCVPGVGRDIFVPVANALTGEGEDVDDSWRHYLDLAKVASSEADELGRQIIEIGSVRDMRREGAQLALGQMCGGFPESEDLVEEDGDAAACLEEDTIDVVYFGTEQDAVDDLGDTVCATGGPLVDTELCKRVAGTGTEPLSVAALGFTTADAAAGEATATWNSGFCDEIYKDFGEAFDVDQGSHQTPPYAAFISGGDLSQGRALQAVNRLSLSEVDLVGHDWVLSRGQSPVLAFATWPKDANGDIIDTTVAGKPAPGLFGEFPGCYFYSRDQDHVLNCSDSEPEDWAECCSPQAKKIMELIGAVPGTTPEYSPFTWRSALETALWKLGYAAGSIPEGLFTVPVPGLSLAGGAWPSPDERILDFRMSIGGDGLEREIPLLNGTSVTRGTWATEAGDLFVRAPGLTSGANSGGGLFWERYEGPFDLLRNGDAPESDWLMTIARNAPLSYPGAGTTVADFKNRLFNPAAPPVCSRAGKELIPNAGTLLMIKVDSCSSPEVLEGLDPSIWPTLAELMPNSNIVPDPQNYRARPYGHMCPDSSPACNNGGPAEEDDCQGNFAAVCDACEVSKHQVTIAVVGQECRAADRALASLTWNSPGEKPLPLAAALMCLASESRTIEVASPPVVRSAADVDVLRTWLEGQAKLIAGIQRQLFAIGIPAAAVEYHQKGLVPYGVVGSGERGNQILQIAISLEEVDSGFRAVRSGVEHLASALGGAESQFEAVELAGDKELLGVALQKVDAGRQVAQGAITIARGLAASANFFSGLFSGGSTNINGGFDVAAGVVDTASGMEKLSLLDEVAANAALQEVNSNAQIIVDLNAAMLEGVQEIEAGISQIGQAQLAVATTLNEIANRETAARVQESMLSGDDFADLDGDGEPDVALPVNTFYRRQYDVLRERYDSALASAKRYAYYARLAMEQRLGVRLATIHEPVGPVPPPGTWVDDLCQMTGIDYEALRTACAAEDEGCIDGGTELDESKLIAEFADQYVGDYVDQLEEFLENYNIKYPFQDSEDLAVISVRDHVITPQVCDALPTNLLASSGDLTHVAAASAPGWIHAGCSADSCLAVEPAVDTAAPAEGLALAAPLDPPIPGGASQVRVFPRSEADFPPDTESAEPVFPTSLYQEVELEAGATYELSWWDSGATVGEDELPEGGQLYYAIVFDAHEDPLVFDLHDSHQRTASETWSERKQVQFTVPYTGQFFVGFQFLAEGATAMANVQLANLADTVAADASYVHTDQFGNNACAGATAESFAEHFDHKCDDRGCFYELDRDFSLKDVDILDSAFAEAGIPAGNYNYRHVGVALNAVGTGLVDCDGQGTSCFANAFLEYDLEHAAFQSQVTNYGGDQQCFSFGRGAIRHGKMLAAERVLGIPMSATDEDLLAGEDFMKPVFKGRPIDGTYRLRIYEREGLNIEQLEDVQLVLQHVYWSRVERSPD